MILPNKGYDNNSTYFEHNLNNYGIPNIFIHGVGLNHNMWNPLKEFFKKNQIVFFDLLNHGNSKKNYKKLNFEDFVLQIEELLEYLKIKKCNLIGFSIGALIAQHFAIKNSNKLNKLILIGSVFQRNKDQIALVKKRYELAKKGDNIANEAIKRWFNNHYIEENPHIINLFFDMLKANKREDFLSAYKVFVNADDYILNFDNFEIETLIMTGENELGSTPEMSTKLNKKLNNSQLFIIPKAKHMASYEESEVVNKKLYQFINN